MDSKCEQLNPIKLRDAAIGKYILTAFEPVESQFGSSYKLFCKHLNDNTEHLIYSNKFVSKYISEHHPKTKFVFEIYLENDIKKVKIAGYTRKVTLQ